PQCPFPDTSAGSVFFATRQLKRFGFVNPVVNSREETSSAKKRAPPTSATPSTNGTTCTRESTITPSVASDTTINGVYPNAMLKSRNKDVSGRSTQLRRRVEGVSNTAVEQ